MNSKKVFALVVSCTLFFLVSKGQEKYSKVKIPVTSVACKNFIFERLDLDHYSNEGNAIVAVLNSADLNRLRFSGYPYELLIDDVVSYTTDLNRNGSAENAAPFQSNCQKLSSIISTPAAFGLGGSLRLGAASGNPGYFTYAEMIAKMQSLATSYPGIVNMFSIGNSANGTAIYAIKISDNVSTDENEPEVLYTGLQHAREAIGGTGLMFFMQYLAENYSADSRVKGLIDNREIFIIPCMNPDGYAYNYSGASSSYPVTGGGLWRKNRRNTGGGASNIGVDLNRNYGIDWGNCAGASSSCGSSVKTDETYYGPNAFSEPETQALRSFVFAHHFVNAIDQHCFGPYYSLPYGRPSLHPVMNHEDSSYYTYIPALMGLYNGHRAGNSPETVAYEVAGGIKDWLLMGDIGTGTKGKIYGMTGEAGGNDFWAPVAQILQLCKETCFQDLQLAYAAGDYYDIEDKNDIAVNSLTGRFAFQLRRVGLSSSPVTISLIPLNNLHTVGESIIRTFPLYYSSITDSISYTLPNNFICGQTIRYAWKVEAGGITTYDTVTKFYNPLILLADDMEGSFNTNWTGSISPAGPTGWSFTNSSSFSGTHSLTESPTGNYTANSTRIVTYKNTLDLSDASSTYLSFWTKHRAENFRDKLQVQASADGSTWVALCGSTTVSEDNTTNGGSLGGQPALTGIRNNWTRELFDLANYNGKPSVQFRFKFTSDNDASNFAFEKDDGFYIDNLKLVKVTAVTTLAVKFGNFNAQLLWNNTVRLNWEAYTDQEHDYFEVERATDKNSDFISIAKTSGLPPYQEYDYAPETGNNYYRIKEVDKNGIVSYSNIIKINVQNDITTTIYPNPVKKQLSVRIRSVISKDIYLLRVLDVAGRKMLEQKAAIEPGVNEIKLNLEALPPQLYILQVINSKNKPVDTEKFMKIK